MALQIVRNNIINVEADAIVNTANPAAGVGRGVDASIYEAAGWDRLLEARRKIGEISPGEAAWTPAFDLRAKIIIHTVGPAWRGGGFGEREIVAGCYRKSLELAAELGCESIAFPLIATGTYGFPKDEALKIAMSEISGFLLGHEMEVLLVVYDKESFEVSGKLFSDIKSFIDEPEETYHYGSMLSRDTGAFDIDYMEAARNAEAPQSVMHEAYRSAEPRLMDVSEAPSGPEPRIDGPLKASRKTGLFDRLLNRGKIREEAEEQVSAEDASDMDALFDSDTGYRRRTGATEGPRHDEIKDGPLLNEAAPMPYRMPYPAPQFPTEKESLENRLKHLDKTFQEYLFMLIDRRGMTDTDVYKKANIDRKHFSKIRSNVDYKPSKKTALALAIALELSLDETKDLLGRAGMALSPSLIFDRIIEYCIETSNFDIYEINCILFKYDQPTLGA